MSIETFSAFALYFLILIGIGVLSHRKNTSEAEFVIGARSLNYWVTALSAHASDMSSWLFMAFPMAVFVAGPSQIWIAIGLLLGMFLSWQLVAPRLRRATEEYDCYTISSYFQKRFGDQTGMVQTVSAIMTLLFMVNYLSVGLTTIGVIFESVFGTSYLTGITLATIVITGYTLIGGFITVAWTDMFQAVFLLLVLILVPFLAFSSMGGIEPIKASALVNQINLSLIPAGGTQGFIQIVFLVLGWGLGYFGQLHIMTKFMGIANPAELNKSKWLGMTWQLLAMGAAAAVGWIAIGFFPNGLLNPELVFVEMVRQLFSTGIGAFVLCAMLAAVISTMDSQLLVSAGVLSEDLGRVFNRSKQSEGQMLSKSRWGVATVAAIAWLIALSQNSVMDTVTYSWTGLGCSFGPLILMSLYYKRTNLTGAVAGIVVGGGVAACWQWINPLITDLNVPAMIPGFSLALLAIWTGSHFGTVRRSVERLNMV